MFKHSIFSVEESDSQNGAPSEVHNEADHPMTTKEQYVAPIDHSTGVLPAEGTQLAF